MSRRIGRPSAAARSNGSGPHSNQPIGCSPAARRYGEWAVTSRFGIALHRKASMKPGPEDLRPRNFVNAARPGQRRTLASHFGQSLWPVTLGGHPVESYLPALMSDLENARKDAVRILCQAQV